MEVIYINANGTNRGAIDVSRNGSAKVGDEDFADKAKMDKINRAVEGWMGMVIEAIGPRDEK